MNESFLQHLWRYQLLNISELSNKNNITIQVKSPGLLNTDAGPDFFNARILIGDTLWAGNIEIHKTIEDWYNHKHHQDEAYNNVILHVSLSDDPYVIAANGQEIPNVKMMFNPSLWTNYQNIINSNNEIACRFSKVDTQSLLFNSWLDRLMAIRLMKKAERFTEILKSTNNDFEESAYIFLASAFGFKINAQPFEQLARIIPFRVIRKFKEKPFQILQMYLTVSGLMNNEKMKNLLSDGIYFLSKHSIIKKSEMQWKQSKTRPANFPLIRIIQFSVFIARIDSLINSLLVINSIEEMKRFFSNSIPTEITNVFIEAKGMGASSINGLIMNSVIPMLFVYAKHTGNEGIAAKSFELYSQLEAERNNIIAKYEQLGFFPSNAFESQALLELYTDYCSPKNCLECPLGNELIKN